MDSKKTNPKQKSTSKEERNKAEGAKASKPAPTKIKVMINSLEELDQLTDEQVKAASLGGASRAKLKKHLEGGLDYITAKRLVIRENFENAKKRNQGTPNEHSTSQKRPRSSSSSTPKSTSQSKRPRQTGGTLPTTAQPTKKAKKEYPSIKEALESVKVAIMQEKFPENKLAPDILNQLQEAISEAHDNIPIEGPQVRFAKCTHKPGYLVITCADRTSADWLKGIVPSLRPGGEPLKALEGDEIPKPVIGTTFVPDERGQKPEAEKILSRLKVANHSLNTGLWTIMGKTTEEKGQTWTFSMDQESAEEIKKLNMLPYYNLGRLKFRFRGEQSKFQAPEPKQRPSSEAGKSPLKRQTAHEGEISMEEDEAPQRA